MYARVTTIQSTPHEYQDDIRALREASLPMIQRQPGFKGLYVLADHETSKLLVVTLWESVDALEASAEMAKAARAQSRMLGIPTERVDEFEIIDQA